MNKHYDNIRQIDNSSLLACALSDQAILNDPVLLSSLPSHSSEMPEGECVEHIINSTSPNKFMRTKNLFREGNYTNQGGANIDSNRNSITSQMTCDHLRNLECWTRRHATGLAALDSSDAVMKGLSAALSSKNVSPLGYPPIISTIIPEKIMITVSDIQASSAGMPATLRISQDGVDCEYKMNSFSVDSEGVTTNFNCTDGIWWYDSSRGYPSFVDSDLAKQSAIKTLYTNYPNKKAIDNYKKRASKFVYSKAGRENESISQWISQLFSPKQISLRTADF